MTPAIATVHSLTNIPSRLHHHAYVVADQGRTNDFYEGLLGMPLNAFWIEDTEYENEAFVLSHAFYGLQDGGALAFFSFADPAQQERFKSPVMQKFNHIALRVDAQTQDHLAMSLAKAKYKSRWVQHGYCRSLYVIDPDGLRLEFTLDSPEAEEIDAVQRRTARDSLRSWLEGGRKSNNAWRHD